MAVLCLSNVVRNGNVRVPPLLRIPLHCVSSCFKLFMYIFLSLKIVYYPGPANSVAKRSKPFLQPSSESITPDLGNTPPYRGPTIPNPPCVFSPSSSIQSVRSDVRLSQRAVVVLGMCLFYFLYVGFYSNLFF